MSTVAVVTRVRWKIYEDEEGYLGTPAGLCDASSNIDSIFNNTEDAVEYIASVEGQVPIPNWREYNDIYDYEDSGKPMYGFYLEATEYNVR